MLEWYRALQKLVDTVDEAIAQGADHKLTLGQLADSLGYSPYHTSRVFHSLAGMPLREYLGGRRLAFSLLAVRDSDRSLLEIALDHGFSSHAAFSRAFKAAYGVSPAAYRRRPVPVVLRTKINPLDRYFLAQGVDRMQASAGTVNTYAVRVPEHKFLHIKNYESDGYFDFWKRQEAVPGLDCDTVCGVLDSVRGKLDGDDRVIGQYSGQIMGYPREADGRRPEAYGVRLPADYAGDVPPGMLLLDVAEGEYLVFEHGPFDFETQGEAAYQKVEQAVETYSWAGSGYRQDDAAGRIAYYYNDPTRFLKMVVPVEKE